MDDEDSCPIQDNLILTGFEYKGFAGDSTPTEADKRIKWIRLQPKELFSTQPYEHLAKVYRQIGHESDAREVMIAKQEDLRKYGALSKKAKLWNWFLGETIGHGYKPIKAIGIIIVFLIFGNLIFSWANNYGVMQPSKERVYMSKEFQEKRSIPPEYPKFNPVMYSMDVFVPFLDLHQEDYWLPDASKPYGFWFRIYFWFHILCGWGFLNPDSSLSYRTDSQGIGVKKIFPLTLTLSPMGRGDVRCFFILVCVSLWLIIFYSIYLLKSSSLTTS